MARRRSYNPFKMWGSYIGAAAGAGLALATTSACGFAGQCSTVAGFNAVMIGALPGFLIGWGFHCLFSLAKELLKKL